MDRRPRHVSVLCLAALLAGPSLAGPLAPPAGPVAPTHKTLSQLEPRTPISAATTPGDQSSVFVISQPGNYYLPADVAVPAGKNGILVAAPDVTIDLAGFAVRGEPGSLSGVITVESARLTLRNGAIRNCGGHGVSALAAPSSRFEGLAITACGAGLATGDGSTADRCSAEGCAGDGFVLESRSILRDCTAAGNAADGFQMQGRSQTVRCTAQNNQSSGFRVEGHANIVRECTSMDNGAFGISVQGTGALITGNYCSGHTGTNGNITVHTTATDNALTDNILMSNGEFTYAIHVVSTGNLVARNRAGGGAGFNVFSGNAQGPLIGLAGMQTNTNPDANCVY